MRWTQEENEERDYYRAMDADLKIRERLQERPRRIVSDSEFAQHAQEMQREARRRNHRPGIGYGPSPLLNKDFDG